MTPDGSGNLYFGVEGGYYVPLGPAFSGNAMWLNGCGYDKPWASQELSVETGKTYQIQGQVKTGMNVAEGGPLLGSFHVCVNDCVDAHDLAVGLPVGVAAGVWAPFNSRFVAASNRVTIYFYGEYQYGADLDYLIDSVSVKRVSS